MLRLSANLSMLFSEYPWLERFKLAQQHGFQAVEIQFPYFLPALDIQAALEESGLKLVLFNVDAADLLQGGEGLAAVPEKQVDFQLAVALAVEYARVLKPECINVLPGRCLNGERCGEYLESFMANLKYAADTFGRLGIKTVFEAINRYDMPGFLIDSSQQMLEVLDVLNHPDLTLQYDIYHMQRMGENVSAFLLSHMDKIGHIQFADNPGRGQPGSGEIDFQALFAIIANSSYRGWVGAEYKPIGNTVESLGWMGIE